jgi:hypothetical protein
MGWKIYDEAVDMLVRRHRYFPQVFRWRGRRFEIESVDQCWTVTGHGWRRRAHRHYFQVQCAEGTFELFQDLKDGTWHLRRARLLPASRPSVQRVAPAWR